MDPYTLLTIVMLALSWWLLKPRKSPVLKAAESQQQLSAVQRTAASGELARMEVRLVEQHRQLEASLQTRIVLLDSLISDADERIADLRQQIEFAADASGESPQRRHAA